MSNTPSKAEIEALVKRHGATSYRNRADTQHPAYGFTEDGLNGLIDEVLAKWGTPQPAPESIRSILIRCREFIDTTKVPAYPAGADLADEIDVLLAAQPAPVPLSESEYKRGYRDGYERRDAEVRGALV